MGQAMSAEKQSLTLTYTPIVGGDGESRWIRLEQEEPEDETLSMEEAAAIIDELYGIEPCDDGMGGGGEEADPENEPDEEEFDEAMAEMLRRAGICKQPKWWEGVVRVYRSHKRPGYVLRSETAEVRKTEPARESHRQEVDASGAVIELEMPYDGGLTGIPAGVKWTVRGSTVNLDRQISGHLVLRYNTYYERVTMRVPTKVQPEQWRDGMGRASLNPIDISGKTSGDDATERTELPSASVVAIQGDIAASCEMTPPPVDESVDDETIKKICGRDEDDPPHGQDDPQDCWKTIAHYDRCSCSYNKTNEWEERVPVPCEGKTHEKYRGSEEQFGGFVYCPGDDDEELSDPEYYKKNCCRYPSTNSLPRCRTKYAKYTGGHEIKNGPNYWKKIYGENVTLHAVTPEQGYCGDLVTSWNVPQRNCCEDVEPLKPDPDNPKNIEPGGIYKIGVLDGKPGTELVWEAQGGIHFWPSGETTIRQDDHGAYIEAEENICPNPSVTVDDGCFPVTLEFEGTATEGPVLPEDKTLPKNTPFTVSASGGVRMYMWMAGGGLELLGWSPDGSTAYLRTPDNDDWCMGTVTVVDQCGRDAEMSVYNGDKGRWEEIFDFDHCAPPGAPFPPADPESTGAQSRSKPHSGYYIMYHYGESSASKSSGGSCDYRTPGYLPGGRDELNNCPNGNAQMIVPGTIKTPVTYWCKNGQQTSSQRYVMEGPGCCKRYNPRYPDQDNLTYYRNEWLFASRLYRWICEGEA